MTNEVLVVAMPKLGETVTEGTVSSWLKRVGDSVSLDDPLFEVSTDKVDSEIPSPHDGIVLEILVAEGETVPVGTPLVKIGPPGSSVTTGRVTSRAGDPATAAGGGVSLADPAAPAVGGSEAPATASPDVPVPSSDVFEITMPKLGETVTEGTVSSWLKRVGDSVSLDDPLFEVSTDKVDSEIPSPHDGIVLEILVAEGETVPVGTLVARIGEPGAVATSAPSAPSLGPATSPGGTGATGDGGGRMLSPLVRRLAAEHGVDLSTVSGSGASGRIRREDVERAIAAASQTATAAAPAASSAVAPVAAPAPVPAAAAAAAPAATGTDPRDEVVTLSRMRLITADLMIKSLNTSAHVWTSVEVDFDAIEKVRQRHKDRFKKEVGASLSYLPFIARATCDALRAFPVVNSSIDIAAKTMTLHPYVNLGIAVDLDEQGLVVPVVKDADSLNIRGVAKTITTMAAAARTRKLSMADMSGSTFTITNPGPWSSYASSPVINQPNVAILCTDGVKRRPVAVGDAIAVHPVGIIGLVYDHRAFDGSTASKFLMHLRDSLEQRNWDAEVS
jgi:2-oxoglutarate dehydrogenase E2 component (dihydrolipoamide succinyltransferase)